MPQYPSGRAPEESVLPAVSNYGIVVILILAVMGIAAIILLLTYLIGPKRSGPIKHSVYESGVDPTGDARKRFNVRFYLVAVLFLIFDVEIIFLYPWAVLFPRLKTTEGADQQWASQLAADGFTPMFFAVGIGVFFLLLTIGFVYEWRKGVFRWD
ncbi:MAG: NADH-quinone oxidoreductase subunit A [Planctomycetes bacterium]|nr:NADH-quinone oxidoreductase subunit A [Planctomycetota bacterium]